MINGTNVVTSMLLVLAFLTNVRNAKRRWVKYLSYTMVGVFALSAVLSLAATINPQVLDRAMDKMFGA